MEKALKQAFRVWKRKILEHGRLTKPLPKISLRFTESQQISAQILVRNQPIIEVSYHFLLEIEAELRNSASYLIKSCLSGLEFPPDQEVHARQSIYLASRELVASFIILHELFHILCGHIADLQANGSLALDEIKLARNPADGMSRGRFTILTNYYREMEADCCSLQCLLLLPLPKHLQSLVASIDQESLKMSRDTAASELSGVSKVIAYRFVLASVWIMVRQFERKRNPKSRSHPLPDARLLASISTIFEEFLSLPSTRQVDTAGQPHHILTDRTAKQAKIFLNTVIKPFVDSGLTEKQRDMMGPEKMLFEFGNMLRNNSLKTKAGIELTRLNAVRMTMDKRLRGLRYYEGIKNRYEKAEA